MFQNVLALLFIPKRNNFLRFARKSEYVLFPWLTWNTYLLHLKFAKQFLQLNVDIVHLHLYKCCISVTVISV